MEVVRLVFAWIPFGWCFGFTPPEGTRHAIEQKGPETLVSDPDCGWNLCEWSFTDQCVVSARTRSHSSGDVLPGMIVCPPSDEEEEEMVFKNCVSKQTTSSWWGFMISGVQSFFSRVSRYIFRRLGGRVSILDTWLTFWVGPRTLREELSERESR